TLILANTGTNSYSGGTTVNNGTLKVGAAGALNGALTVNAGTLDLNAVNTTLSTLSGSSGAVVTNTTGTAALTVSSSSNSSYSGFLQDGGSQGLALAKAGSGTLTLSASNNYSGGTSINAGSIALGHDSALGRGTVNFAGGAAIQSADATTRNI